MTCYLRSLVFFGFLVLAVRPANAQSDAGSLPLPDSTVLRLAESNTIDIYRQFMGEQSRLFNGYEHVGFLPMTNGQPYFQEDALRIGSVVYEGGWYRDVPMMYDLVRDELITTTPNNARITLSNDKVAEFFLLGHHFIRTPGGYADLLVNGKIKLEVRRIKVIQERTDGLQIIRNVEQADHYYIVQDGVSRPIGNLRSLLALLKDKKKEITQDLKRKKIKFRKDREGAFIEAVSFYNQSIPQ
jgi:hypothetical protein